MGNGSIDPDVIALRIFLAAFSYINFFIITI